MTFFDNIKMYAPIGLSDKEISDRLNDLETILFDTFPFILEAPEEEQNRIVEYIWRLSFRKHS